MADLLSPRHVRKSRDHLHKRNISDANKPPTPSPTQSKYVRDCACGRGLSCVGMTQAFRMLQDPRCYYVELPRYKRDPTAYKYVFRNNLRAAYLRHLSRMNPNLNVSEFDLTQRRYVALHHFHPAVVRAFYENPLTSAQKHKVPISITEHEMKELGMEVHDEDRILSVTGIPTGGYYFCPNYPQDKVHEDLKALIKHERSAQEAKAAMIMKKDLGREYTVPKNIEITTAETNRVAENSTMDLVVKKSVSDMSCPDDTEMKKLPGSRVEEILSETKEEPAAEDGNNYEAVHEESLSERKDEPVADEDDIHEEAPHEGILTESKDESVVEDDDVNELVALPTKEDEGDFNIATDIEHPDFDSLWEDTTPDVETPSSVSQIVPLHHRIDAVTENVHESSEDEFQEDDKPPKHEAEYRNFLFASEDSRSEPETPDVSILEADSGENQNVSYEPEPGNTDASSTIPDLSISRTSSRETDHPWQTPKYRRTRQEETKRISSGPAHFIDPTVVTPPRANSERISRLESKSKTEDKREPVAEEKTVLVEALIESVCQESKTEEKMDAKEAEVGSVSKLPIPVGHMNSIVEQGSGDIPKKTEPSKTDPGSGKVQLQPLDPPGKSYEYRQRLPVTPPRSPKVPHEKSDERSLASDDSVGFGAIKLCHNLPGADPTLRIQVHNDLIAWESKRRSDMNQELDFNREQWKTVRDILRDGVGEVDVAERLVVGFAKAGMLFAEAYEAMYDDRLLDDAGNTVTNSFLQNRLQKKRRDQEYSMENSNGQSAVGGQSTLLNSIIEAQLELAKSFRDCSHHIEDEIAPEIRELKVEIQSRARELEAIGDTILAELQRSEIEVKNIWDVFDAMVTGDLMEYSTHGSLHGGGSLHSSMGGTSGSVHGFLTPRGENEAPIVSSVHSPLVKTTFRQLGAVEDGWLIEMYYRSAVSYQRSVYSIAENELNNLFKEVINLEERRFQKLRQAMLAFVPRQRRLFVALPEGLRGVLDNLVGLRIDEDSLQSLIDDAIRDRSHDHFKRASSHRSSIMNRSRIRVAKESPEDELEDIESNFGNPFQSKMVMASKVAELKPSGLSSIMNAAWRGALLVVTTEGNFHVFEVPEGMSRTDQTPFEAFKALYPPMDFSSTETWILGRKADIVRSLTPSVTLNLSRCNMTIVKMRNRQLEIVEDVTHSGGGNRFLKAVKAAGSQGSKKCTLRLPSASDATDLMAVLERIKKEFRAKDNFSTHRIAKC